MADSQSPLDADDSTGAVDDWDLLDHDDASGDGFSFSSPRLLHVVASATAAVGIATIVLGESIVMNLAGYVIGCVATLLAVALSRRFAEQRAARYGIGISNFSRYYSVALTLVALAVAVGNSYLIATQFG